MPVLKGKRIEKLQADKIYVNDPKIRHRIDTPIPRNDSTKELLRKDIMLFLGAISTFGCGYAAYHSHYIIEANWAWVAAFTSYALMPPFGVSSLFLNVRDYWILFSFNLTFSAMVPYFLLAAVVIDQNLLEEKMILTIVVPPLWLCVLFFRESPLQTNAIARSFYPGTILPVGLTMLGLLVWDIFQKPHLDVMALVCVIVSVVTGVLGLLCLGSWKKTAGGFEQEGTRKTGKPIYMYGWYAFEFVSIMTLWLFCIQTKQ